VTDFLANTVWAWVGGINLLKRQLLKKTTPQKMINCQACQAAKESGRGRIWTRYQALEMAKY
jgi:hypothetical protein